MSKKEENGCFWKSGRPQHCNKEGPPERTRCQSRRNFCMMQGTGGRGADLNKAHHHDSGTCPYLAKMRQGCSAVDKDKKDESVPQDCATWLCWYYYMMGRRGGYQTWGQDRGVVPPCFGDSGSSESEEESAEQEGMDTEAVSSEGAATQEGNDATSDEDKCEGDPNMNDPVPVEFLQWACWAYYMLGTNEAGGPPHMGQFGPRPFMHPGFGPHGFPSMHGDGEMDGYGPFGHHGDYDHHHPRGHHHYHGHGPFGRHHGHHGKHGHHGPPFLFPGMGGFGGMFGFSHHGDWRRGGHCHGRGGFRGHQGPPSCPKMCQTKSGKEDTSKSTE